MVLTGTPRRVRRARRPCELEPRVMRRMLRGQPRATVPPNPAHRGTPTAPSFRVAFSNTSGTAAVTSLAVTIPNTAVVGDVAIAVVSAEGLTFATPAGWTKLDTWTPSITPLRGTVFKKKLIAGDPNSSVTFTGTGSANIICIAGACYQGAEDVGVAARFGDLLISPGIDGGNTPRIGAIACGPRDLIVTFGATKSWSSTDLNQAKISTAGTGYTIRANVGAAQFLQFAYGAWLCDAPASQQMVTPTPSSPQCFHIAGALALSPANRKPTHQLPGSLLGAALHAYGTSLLCYVAPGTTSPSTPWYSAALWVDRIARQMGPVGTLLEENNLGMAGGYAQEICGFAYGTVSYPTRGVSGGANALNQAGTWMSMTNRTGLVLLDTLGNDALNYRNTANGATMAKALASARNATDALVRLLRASSYTHDSDGSLTYAGTWTTVSANDLGGGACRSTTTPNSTVTFTTTQTDIDLVLLGIDNANAGAAGSNFTVTIDGVQVVDGTTSDQCKMSAGTSGSSPYNHAAYCQMCVPLRGMAAGTKTIVVKHTGAAGQILRFDGYLVASATPPWIVLNKLGHFSPLVYSSLGFGGSDADLDIFSATCDSIRAAHSDGKVLVFDPLDPVASGGVWDYTTMVNNTDFVHLTDVGAAHFKRGIVSKLQECVA